MNLWDNGLIAINRILGKHNLANGLTKALRRADFEAFKVIL